MSMPVKYQDADKITFSCEGDLRGLLNKKAQKLGFKNLSSLLNFISYRFINKKWWEFWK